ncbi:MAG: HAD family hydrolase, partial [Leptospiraceae bacterium]|nr:HAD family hydrolase [Leptospiraceae bacterium]
VFEKYSIGIWSAGSDYYVKLITERLIPESIEIDFIWARSRCSFKGHPLKKKDENDNSLYSKDLSLLKKYGYSMQRILIVDDTPRVCLLNLSNAIFVRPYFGEALDSELFDLEIYLRKLSTEENFQRIDKENWKKNPR